VVGLLQILPGFRRKAEFQFFHKLPVKSSHNLFLAVPEYCRVPVRDLS
jgi:hypothetical protein